jgi:hypothetical protein
MSIVLKISYEKAKYHLKSYFCPSSWGSYGTMNQVRQAVLDGLPEDTACGKSIDQKNIEFLHGFGVPGDPAGSLMNYWG